MSPASVEKFVVAVWFLVSISPKDKQNNRTETELNKSVELHRTTMQHSTVGPGNKNMHTDTDTNTSISTP
jgi:hypothetical protein